MFTNPITSPHIFLYFWYYQEMVVDLLFQNFSINIPITFSHESSSRI